MQSYRFQNSWCSCRGAIWWLPQGIITNIYPSCKLNLNLDLNIFVVAFFFYIELCKNHSNISFWIRREPQDPKQFGISSQQAKHHQCRYPVCWTSWSTYQGCPHEISPTCHWNNNKFSRSNCQVSQTVFFSNIGEYFWHLAVTLLNE